jgi:hypothetical protein
MAAERSVVGHPTKAERWRLSSNSAPLDASTSQLAIAFAIASGKPKRASVAAYSASGKFFIRPFFRSGARFQPRGPPAYEGCNELEAVIPWRMIGRSSHLELNAFRMAA